MVAVIVSLASLSLLVTLLSYAAVLQKLSMRHRPPRSTPGISILKPLKGTDDELYENLRAFAELDYPDYEVLLGAECGDDPALVIARRVKREFPDAPFRVFVGARDVGLNPKVRLLSRLIEEARSEWVLVSDSNVRPRSDYLNDLMACQERTGAALVHSPLAGVGEKSLGATLENLQMNSWVISAIGLSDACGHPCVIGKSMLMKRSVLARLGGFHEVRDILAEDYILGETFHRAGERVVLSPHILPVFATERPFSSFVNRHVRWGQLRRRISPLGFVSELVMNPLPWLVLLTCVGTHELRVLSLLGFSLKVLADTVLSRLVRGTPLPLSQVLLIPVKDVLGVGMWAVAALRTRVSWRGNHMRIVAGSRLVPIEAELRPAESEA
jgi:ceramide glucosyltransferase